MPTQVAMNGRIATATSIPPIPLTTSSAKAKPVDVLKSSTSPWMTRPP